LFGEETGFYAEHHYLVYRDGAGVEEIVDASWQLFIPRDVASDNNQLPKVLIGSRVDFVGRAVVAGMPDEALDFWRPIEEAKSVVKVML
jgi:hypothetical protein